MKGCGKNNKKNRIRKKRIQIKNKKLIKKYPWLMPRNVWTRKPLKDYDYSFIEWEWPKGWQLAFGDMFLEEFGEAVKRLGLEHELIVEQQKEKFGELRFYFYPSHNELERIVDKYTHLSRNICICCGKPDVPIINTGWISPECYPCFYKNARKQDKYYRKYTKNYTPKTEQEIQELYDKSIDKNNQKMDDFYTIICYNKGSETEKTFDISETAEKIRKRWRKRHESNN